MLFRALFLLRDIVRDAFFAAHKHVAASYGPVWKYLAMRCSRWTPDGVSAKKKKKERVLVSSYAIRHRVFELIKLSDPNKKRMFRHVGNASADTLLMFRFLGSGTSRKTGHLYFVSAMANVHYCVASTLKREFVRQTLPANFVPKLLSLNCVSTSSFWKKKEKKNTWTSYSKECTFQRIFGRRQPCYVTRSF